MNLNAIVLRDIPKEEARIDLFRCPIQGGFRGFRAEVPLVGWHYVSVKVDAAHVGFWCRLAPNEAVVRVFDSDQGFVAADPEAEQQYAQMALGGAMNQALTPYPIPLYAHWFGLVSHLGAENFPPQLHAEDSGAGSRFEKALGGTHEGQAAAFLAEFQYAFVRWLVSLDTGTQDDAAFARWRHLLLAAYNAGEHRIRDAGALFGQLASILPRQFDLLPAAWFTADSFLLAQVNYMVEDMVDCGEPPLMEAGQALARYLQKYQG